MSVQQVNAKLREVFDRFDEDSSGYVSTEELSHMMASLKMDVSPAKLRKIMVDADPDGSGEISFDEFSKSLKKQLNSGDMEGIASVVLAGGGTFGWLNPLSWFQSETTSEPVRETPSRSGSPSRGSPSDTPGKYYSKTPESVRSAISTDFTPTHRMTATQGLVQANNQAVADEVKARKREGQVRSEAMRARFLQRQQQKNEVTHHQRVETHEAVEHLKDQKRYEGWVQKQKLSEAWDQEVVKKKKFAAKVKKGAALAKKAKEHKAIERVATMAAEDASTSAAGQLDHVERKERLKAAKRAAAEEAKERTAMVRHATRPEVRQEGRVMFQAQRDAIVAAEKEKQEIDFVKIQEAKQKYLEKQEAMKSKVTALREVARAARGNLEEVRKQQAAHVRHQLEGERRRKAALVEETRQRTQEKHDEVYTWHKMAIIEP